VPRCDASLIDEVAPPTAVRSPANFALCFRPPRNRGPRRTTIAAPGRLLMPSATKEQIDSFNELQRKFVALQRSNHVLLEHNPATQRLLEEVSLFLAN